MKKYEPESQPFRGNIRRYYLLDPPKYRKPKKNTFKKKVFDRARQQESISMKR